MTISEEKLEYLLKKDQLTAKNFPLTYAQREIIVIALRKSGYSETMPENVIPTMEKLKKSVIDTIELSIAEKITRQVFHPVEKVE